MRTFNIRPYFGYDCDSDNGFNNGHYIDAITVTASDENDAIDQAMRLYQQDHALHPNAEIDGWFGDGTIYWVLSYNNANGDTITEQEYVDLAERFDDLGGYLYQYIDFNNVQEHDDITYNQEPEINPDR